VLSSLRTAEEIRGIDEAGAGLSPSRPGSMTRQYLCPLLAASMRAREVGLPTCVDACRSDVQTIRLMPPRIRWEGAREAEGS